MKMIPRGFGAEGSVALTLRATRYFRWDTDAEVFVPFTNPAEVIVSWDNELAMELGRGVSLNYDLGLLWLPQVTRRIAFQQGASLRIAFQLL